MDIKNVLKTIQFNRPCVKTNHLSTNWGDNMLKDGIIPLVEYPRPQLKRDGNFRILNGIWDYIITDSPALPAEFTGEILVPFSPETYLSTICRTLLPGEYLWYHRKLKLDSKNTEHSRYLLHFGAVDQTAVIYLNGTEIARHTGGYLPFTVDLTSTLSDGYNDLVIRVVDGTDHTLHSRGKQMLKHHGMFYTPQSGIWQTVWIEKVPTCYIRALKLTPDYDNRSIQIRMLWNKPNTASKAIQISYQGQTILSTTTHKNCITCKLSPELFYPWSPEKPCLYDLTVTDGIDTVSSYFALRKVSIDKDTSGKVRIFLNNRPYFMNGVLDQGYWPGGLMTCPSDEGLIHDITSMKELGFNTIRKHCKLETERFYYHCDRIGMLVWQDMVNGGGPYSAPLVTYLPTLLNHFGLRLSDHHLHLTARTNEAGRQEWQRECQKTIETLYNHPCIVVWVPFNEGWGQFNAADACQMIKHLDATRLVDHASGWFDQGCGDLLSEHNYFYDYKVKQDGKRAYVLSEYGGYACLVKGHSYSDQIYGYQKYDSLMDLKGALTDLFAKISLMEQDGLSAAIYTQLSDIEEEVNGLLTYDRKINKLK